MKELAKLFKEQELHRLTNFEIGVFFKKNLELYNTFKSYWSILDPHYSKNTIYRVIHTIAAYPIYNNIYELIEHINSFLIDSEGEVSPSKFVLLNRINPDFNNIIINNSINFPTKMTITGRCELLRKGIFELPKCVNCDNLVSWYNSSNLLTHCSKKCSDNSNLTKKNRSQTMVKLYGVTHYSKTDEFLVKSKKTRKEKYGDDGYTNREQAKKTWINIYGVDNPLKDKSIRKKITNSMKERHGVEHYVIHPEFKDKSEKTLINNYGVTRPLFNEKIKKKIQNTMKKKHGVENYVTHPDFQEKSKNTCMSKYGFSSSSQSPEIYKKIQKSLFAVKQFEDTNLTYQGSYELHFLTLMKNKNLLKEISIPEPVIYYINNTKHVYNPDYKFRGEIIEIKSTWTYNRNGTDKNLETKNHAKWNAVKESGENIIVLKSKKEIKNFVDLL